MRGTERAREGEIDGEIIEKGRMRARERKREVSDTEKGTHTHREREREREREKGGGERGTEALHVSGGPHAPCAVLQLAAPR